ncbi:hypothetical protein CVT26_009672 [Gymnopilus dilepis]|uniref:F-box domain-containing protein n=1 Tax=Gymnopilus dilepis TaxID=231916 RepID=A0A409YBK9_9AGAR|nr:hypothetical protein CVT26_009672 [Gymnopilus dilepis]
MSHCSRVQEVSPHLVSVDYTKNELSSAQNPFRHAPRASFDSLLVEIISIIFIDCLEGDTCFGPRTGREWLKLAMADIIPQLDCSDIIRIDQDVAKSSLCSSLKTSFDSLPAEITSVIFEHYVHCAHSPEQPHSPLTLGKICGRWRQIAWSTPNLWTHLPIYHRHSMSPTHVELAEEWLSRSGTLPLVIEFSSFCDGFCPEHAVVLSCNQMLEVLGRCSDRWTDLSLIVPYDSLKGLILPLVSCALHHFSLSLAWNNDHHFQLDRHPGISSFSNFTSEIVEFCCVSGIDLDWTCLTNLTIDHLSNIGFVLQVFRSAPNLAKCTLKDIRDYHPETSTIFGQEIVTCPVLDSLDVSFGSPESPEDLFSALSLPALKHLSFRSSQISVIEFSVDDLTLFLEQSSCALTSLVIDEWEFEQGTLILLLPFLFSLTKLHIFRSEDYDYDNHIFYRLLADPSQSSTRFLPTLSSTALPYLPSIETFTWEGYGPYPWETLPGLLKSVVPNAASHLRPLKFIKIDCITTPARNPYIPVHVLQQLQVAEYSDVKFEFTMYNPKHSRQAGVDLWKASQDRIEMSGDIV